MPDMGTHTDLFQWTDRDRTGVRLLDRDHMMVVQQAQLLSGAVDRSDALSAGSAARFLLDFIPQMFEREDRLMANSGHPGRGDHQDSHRTLMARILSRTGVKGAQALETGQTLRAALMDWRSAHVPHHDHALAIHVRGVELKPFETGGARRLSGNVHWDRLSVMVVDGQFAFRGTARAMLKDLGVKTILEARDGVDALKVLQERPADIVLVDQHMAPMDGAEFTRVLRNVQDSPAPRAVVILLTGEDISQGFINRALDAGIHDLLRKPLSLDTLRARLERHVLDPLPFREAGRLVLPVHLDKAAMNAMRRVG
jgi:hemerythrin-like metal-binding protein